MMLGNVLLLALAAFAHGDDAGGVYGYNAPGARVAGGETPPVAWELKKQRTCMRWHRRLKVGSLPVIAGDAVYTTVEPDALCALALEDGAVRWQTALPTGRPLIKEAPDGLRPIISPRFKVLLDPVEQRRRWHGRIRNELPVLRAVIERHPKSGVALQAGELVRVLPGAD